MSFTFPHSRLLAPLFRDEAMLNIFSDAHFVQQMLAVEGTLAQVQGRLGVIPETAVAPIMDAITTFQPNFAQLQTAVEKDGVPVSELVRQLRQHIEGEAAAYVHWGATTQDIMDTAMILQLREAATLLETTLNQTIHQLAALADQHRHTLMAGRTHSQQALPITFGLKVAGWLAPLLRHRQRLAEIKPRLHVVQFGGAVGTLASLGNKGLAVQQALANALSLGLLPTAWHTQRDALAEMAGWLSLVSGGLGKMAQDIILLAQTEVGELQETADPSRGGSSTMPQKQNPVISEGIIAVARTNASLLAAIHHAQIQEHERATHGWQVEWLNLPQMFVLTAAALHKAHFLSQNLVVNDERMRQNVAASNGLMLAEAISLALAPHLGREAAKELVSQACHQAVAQDRHLVDVVRGETAVPLNWDTLREESNYLGAAQALIDQVLNQIKKP